MRTSRHHHHDSIAASDGSARRRLLPSLTAVVALVAGSALSACGRAAGDATTHRRTGSTSTSQAAPTTTLPATTTTTTVPPEPGWKVLASEPTGVAVDERTVPFPDGSTVTLIRFRAGQVHYDLHAGALDPPRGAATVGPNGQDAISAAERPVVLAAFNGGFKVTTGAGGMEINGQDLTPLVTGMASLAVDAGGGASIGVWGQGFPPAGEHVVGVRQNLPPLVQAGQPSPSAGDVAAWGATIGGSSVARSALGQTPTGSLVYAASMSTVPADLADALVAVGVVTAMELDINPEWVQADVAAAAGGTLVAAVPGQHRPPDQYLSGWTRDFVVALAGGPAGTVPSG